MKAFKFKPNRVRRSYTGGKGIDILRKTENPHDGQCPEDWIASNIKAFSAMDDMGISIVDNDTHTKFSELLQHKGFELLGKQHIKKIGRKTGFLMKLLDSAIRLPVQGHPDKLKASELLNSPYGKTEAWLVLETRSTFEEKPYLLMGFNEKIDKEIFIKESIDGILEKGLEMMHKVNVKSGDIFMINGGLPHAIGPGITVIEIMEPSDWIVVSERLCGEVEIDFNRRFNGLSPENAMSFYDFNPISRNELELRNKLKCSKIDDSVYSLIDRHKFKYFGLEKIKVNNSYMLKNDEECCRAGIVTSGEILINKHLKLHQGDTFFLPAVIPEYDLLGTAELILGLPPVCN